MMFVLSVGVFGGGSGGMGREEGVHTVVEHGVRDLVRDGGGILDGKGRPLLHGGAIDGGFIML